MKSEYKYYECEEIANEVDTVSRACPTLIEKTERLAAVLLNEQSRILTTAVPTVLKFQTPGKE